MRTTPAGWGNARSELYRWETQVNIAGVDYNEEDIISVSTSAALYSSGSLGIGGCVAKEIDLQIVPKGTIPRMAEIKVYTRPICDEWWTGWLLKGVYYIDTRQTDRATGVMTIHGYDAMLKAEKIYEPPNWSWPAPMGTVVNHIAGQSGLGVGLDVRTTIKYGDDYMVEYPIDLTMREILGYIAVAHAGNWIITENNELRLVGLADIPTETNYLVSEDGDTFLFGDTRIVV